MELRCCGRTDAERLCNNSFQRTLPFFINISIVKTSLDVRLGQNKLSANVVKCGGGRARLAGGRKHEFVAVACCNHLRFRMFFSSMTVHLHPFFSTHRVTYTNITYVNLHNVKSSTCHLAS
jgi:hypothetical protein